MPKFFITDKNIKEEEITLIGKDVNHIKNVLRKKKGDTITICNTNNKKDYLCEILELEKSIKCKIIEQIDNNVESNIKVTIFQGLPKANKMELIIQKSVELGAYDITPVEMKRCIVKLNEKDKKNKTERWQKISEVAAKQSGRNIITKINNIITVKDICKISQDYDILIVAYENEKNNKLKNELQKLKLKNEKELKIGIVIGPEGGIDEEEINTLKEVNAKIVTLGKRILRTETVALNCLSIIMYELED